MTGAVAAWPPYPHDTIFEDPRTDDLLPPSDLGGQELWMGMRMAPIFGAVFILAGIVITGQVVRERLDDSPPPEGVVTAVRVLEGAGDVRYCPTVEFAHGGATRTYVDNCVPEVMAVGDRVAVGAHRFEPPERTPWYLGLAAGFAGLVCLGAGRVLGAIGQQLP